MNTQKTDMEKNTGKMTNEVNNMLENDFHSIVDTNLRHTIDDAEFQKHNDESEDKCMALFTCCGCCGTALGVAVLLGIATGYVTWLIFAIINLTNVSNEDIKDKCESSNLWPLLLTIVIYNGASLLIKLMSTKSSEYNENNTENYQNEAIKFCLALGLLIWCGIELMEPCARNKLSNKRIYVLLEYWFFFGCAFIALLMCLSCGLITMASLKDKKERKSEDLIHKLAV